MILTDGQINPIDVNFHLQKVWKFLIKIQLKKSDPKWTGGGKCPASYQLGLMAKTDHPCKCFLLFFPPIFTDTYWTQWRLSAQVVRVQKTLC